VTGSLVILNTWAFNGLDSDDQIIIKPDTPLTEWFVDPRGVRAISYLDVIYSNNVSGTTVDCTNGCNDGGNNIDWNFTASAITVSGSVFIDEGVTNIGSGTTVRLAINGVTDNSDTTDANGGFSISSSAPAGSGSVLTLYIDSGGGDAGVTITLSDGNDSTGIDIYRDYLLLRAENGGSVTNSNLDTGNDNADTDIDAIYTMSGTTVTLVNGKELLVWPGFGYTPTGDVNIGTSGATTLLDVSGTLNMGAGETLTVRGTLDVSGEFYGSSATVDVNGDLTVSAGLFSAPTTTLTVSGTVDLAAGTYTHNSSTIEFDGTQQQTVAAGTNTFNQMTVTNASGPGVIFTEAFTTANFTNTTIASTMTFQQSTTFTITNTLTLSGSSGNEIVLDSVDGSTRFTLTVSGGSQSVNYVDVSNSQTSSNNIIASNSNQGANTDAAESAPHWVFPPPVALEVDTGRFTLTAGTGNFSVTGVGFQPSAYILFLTKNDTDDADSAEGSGVGGLISVGMTDGTRQFCMATGSEDNQDTSDV
ncbi:MAG: hypothetical protein K8I00_07990, partial [Candidatus Omnitrophica bacterium]|nr:hypothetical protein [Candidatus Omnitrophota bacterium]